MTRARFQYHPGVMGSLVYFFCVISTFKSVHGDVKGSFKDVSHPKKVTKLNYKYLVFKTAKQQNAFWHLPSYRRCIIQIFTLISFYGGIREVQDGCM